MLRSVNHLKGFVIQATDGEIGKVDQFYFDDATWAIRYLVVNTSRWLNGRLVLISPIALGQKGWESRRLDVALTKKQIEDSPRIDTQHQDFDAGSSCTDPGGLRTFDRVQSNLYWTGRLHNVFALATSSVVP